MSDDVELKISYIWIISQQLLKNNTLVSKLTSTAPNQEMSKPTFWPQRWYVSSNLMVEARTNVLWLPGLVLLPWLATSVELTFTAAP